MHIVIKKTILVSIVATELLTLGFIIRQIYYTKWSNVLGVQNAIILKRENLIYPADDSLRYFYEPKPSIQELAREEWLPYTATYTINSDGLNERFDYQVPKPSETYRILVLGDSETFGIYVNTNDNYSERLEDKLNSQLVCNKFKNFEVINLGVPGYDLQYAAHRFKIRGNKYDPDLIIWRILSNDFQDNNELIAAKVNSYLINKINGENDLNSMEAKEKVALQLKAAQEVWNEYGEKYIAEFQYKQLLEFLQNYQNPVLIFTPRNTSDNYKQLIDLASQSRPNISYVESSDNYDKLPDTHPSVIGHNQIADELFTYLTSQRIISCD